MSSIFNQYNFSSNPFLDERHDYPRVGREDSWNKIRSMLNDYVVAPTCGFVVIFGEYGMGKSFTLKKLEDAINTDTTFLSTNDKTISTMLNTIDSKIPSNYSLELIKRIVRKIGQEKIVELASKVDVDTIQDDMLKNIIEKLANGDFSAWNWFCSRPLSKLELEGLGVFYNMNDPKELDIILTNFFKILKIFNVGNLVILLDEWEFLLSIAARTKLLEIVHELQKIYDSYNENQAEREQFTKIIFVIGSSADAWSKFLEMVDLELESRGGGGTQTFLRRIPHEAFIELAPLTDKNVKEFLLDRINRHRDTKSKSLEPFDNDYVKYISTISQGVPSRILRLSALILKVGAENSIKNITSEEAENIVKSYGLYSEYIQTKA